MTQSALANYLTRFDERESDGAEPHSEPEADSTSSMVKPGEPSPEPEGSSDLPIDAHKFIVELEDRLELERISIDERVKNERKHWTEQESERLSEKIHSAVSGGLSEFERRLAGVLTRLTERKLGERMTEEFCRTIQIALADEESPILSLHGPKDLLESISQKLERRGITISKTIDPQPDIFARFGQTMLQTRVDELLEELRRIAADGR